jgi:hypothetical protein
MPVKRQTWLSVVQLAVLMSSLLACLQFVYANGLVPKDTITVAVVSVVAVLLKLLERLK